MSNSQGRDGSGGYGAPAAPPAYGGSPYGQAPYGLDPYGRNQPYSHNQPSPGNPYAQAPHTQNPHAQNPYAQAAYEQNPYAQPAPPAAPVPPAAPAGEPGYVPAFARGAGLPGPAPRRNRAAVLLQFTLQWVYAPLWIAALVALVVIAMFSPGGGPSGPDSDAWMKPHRYFIPPRRLKAELTGKPEDWERYLAPIVERRVRKAEAELASGQGALGADHSREMTVKLPLRLHRGLGAVGVARIAERHGWQVAGGGAAGEQVWLARTFPAPAQSGAPGPHDPPAAPGTPWGPRPSRLFLLLPFMLLLQLVYLPLWAVLTFWVPRSDPDHWHHWAARWAVGPRVFWPELTGSTAAWERHVHRILERDTAKQLAHPAENYRRVTAPDGTFHRRIRVDQATYRGVGAQHLLRLAAERGWYLDPAYEPRPEVCVRLSRPERTV
ncbi:hypothetical protein ACWGB8_13565 [Kitasatospora sp. NPDC054939]